MKPQGSKKIFIFRHGETDWNKENRFQGHTDIPLNENGRNQARKLAAQLSSRRIQAILTSDLSRAMETAQILAENLGGIPIQIDERLREAHLGEAQGKTFDEIKSFFGEDLTRRWRSSKPTDADVSYPGGETGTAIIARAFAAMEEFLIQKDYYQVGISTHGGVIRRIIHSVQTNPKAEVAIPNCVLYELNYNPETGIWQFVS